MNFTILLTLFSLLGNVKWCFTDENENLLYRHLIRGYASLVKPVRDNNDVVTISIDLRLSRLIDIDEKNQIMTTDLWITQIWSDYRLTWNPLAFNNISIFFMPANQIWLPDLIIHNTANGKYDLSSLTKAELHSNGKVVLKSPAILKSFCKIDVEYFPFDIQSCFIKFSSWTYDYKNIVLTHSRAKKGSNLVKEGIEFKTCLESDEWDIVDTAAKLSVDPPLDEHKRENFYPDIKFCLIMRRKTLFYMVNLIVPCTGMSFLTILVFLLSSKSNEKVTLSISILLALTLFFLLLLDIMPPTSLVVPLFGKYLVFTITMLSLSIFFTIYILNIHHRTPELHTSMPALVRTLFLQRLPRMLFFKDLVAEYNAYTHHKFKEKCQLVLRSSRESIDTLERIYFKNVVLSRGGGGNETTGLKTAQRMHVKDYFGAEFLLVVDNAQTNPLAKTDAWPKRRIECRSGPFRSVNELILENIAYLSNITDRIKRDYYKKTIQEEWKMLAYVLDRLLFYIFGVAFVAGFCYLFMQTPNNYYNLDEIDQEKICNF